MSRPKGSKNKKVAADALKNQIQKINARIRAIKKTFGEDVAKYYTNKMSIPSTDFINKKGEITNSAKKWSSVMEIQKKALMKTEIPTVSSIKAEAKGILEESGVYDAIEADKLNKSQMNELLVKEIQSMVAVESSFEDIKEEYYEFMNKYAIQLDNEQEFRDLMNELATGKGSGIKSYSELANWMERANKLIH